jgi:predicted alpha/beta superfamily hydrolase
MHAQPAKVPRRAALLAIAAAALPAPAMALARPRTVGDRLTVTEPWSLPALGRSRRLRVYLPPSYATQAARRYPVIYCHDGQNLFDDATSYAGEWGVDEALDDLAARHGFEAIAVGIDHGEQLRMQELNPWDRDQTRRGEGFAYLQALVETVKPAIDAGYRTRPEPAHTALVGSSMGGLISHAGLHRHAGVFGLGGVFSPSFWVSPLAVRGLTEAEPLRSSQRVFVYAGGREGPGMVEMARVYSDQLRGQPAAHALLVWPEAEHNERAWRQALPLALRFLFQLPAA